MDLHTIFEIQYTKYTNIMLKVLTSLQFFATRFFELYQSFYRIQLTYHRRQNFHLI